MRIILYLGVAFAFVSQSFGAAIVASAPAEAGSSIPAFGESGPPSGQIAAALGTAAVTVQANDSSGFSYAANPSASFADPNLTTAVHSGDDVLLGTTVLVGTFNGLTDAQIQAHATDIPFLSTNFSQYGAVHVGDGTGVRGTLNGTVTAATLPNFAGKQIYYFLVAGTDNSTPSQSFNTAFQIGIFYLDKSLNSAWTFPADDAIPNTTTVDIADLTNGNTGLALKTGSHIVIGSFGPDKSNSFTAATDFVLANVPEPSSALLLGLSLAATALTRRIRPRGSRC